MRHLAGARRMDLVHRLHRLDDEEGLALLHACADLDEVRSPRCRSKIDSADHRRLDRARMLSRRSLGCCSLSDGGRRGVDMGVNRGSRGRRDARHRIDRLRYAHARALAIEFDLREAGLVQDFRKAGDQSEIGIGLGCRGGFGRRFRGRFLRGGHSFNPSFLM